MNNDQYLATQTILISLARVLETLDLDSFLKRIELANAAGPILSPTLYRDASGNLMQIEHVARAFQDCQRRIAELSGAKR